MKKANLEKIYSRECKEDLKKYFRTKNKKPVKTPYYSRQIKMHFENKYTDWIVDWMLKELVKENYLKKKKIESYNFYYNGRLSEKEDEEKIRRKMMKIVKILEKTNTEEINKDLGKHLETLVKNELKAIGFEIISRNTNEYNGIKWKKTSQNLDMIAKHNKSDLVIGVECKNTRKIIEKTELKNKIEICKKLQITPVFAVRWIKPYLDIITEADGYGWMFKTQIYPLGYKKIVGQLYNKLTRPAEKKKKGRGFPVSVNGELPEKSCKLFRKWVEEKIEERKK